MKLISQWTGIQTPDPFPPQSGNNTKGVALSRNLSSTYRLALAAVLLLPIVLGTSPRPAPYHEFIVHGFISRQAGGMKQNFVVSLVGRFRDFYPDSLIDLDGSAVRHSSPAMKAVTDTSGSFWLDVQANFVVDSLAIKVSAVDRPLCFGELFPVPTSRQEITEESAAEMRGCHGCETVSPAQTYVVGYRYQCPEQTVAVPY